MMMGVSCRMLSPYNLAVRGLQMHSDCSRDLQLENKAAGGSRVTEEETSYMRGKEEEEEDKEEEEEEEDGDEEVEKEDQEEDGDEEENKEESAVQKQQRPSWAPCFFNYAGKEVYHYVGQKIVIEEGFDSYAGMVWPAALALCYYLETHREELSLEDKAVLEIGAGTGLVSIVATLLGGWVTATDLPEVLSNLRVNLCRNTRARCRHTPQVAALSWGKDLERSYPSSVYRYDYVLAADVVYHHDFLDELLVTMKHFCKLGTTLIWANNIRFETDLTFTENFKKTFSTSLLAEDGEMKIFMARSRDKEEKGDIMLGIQDLPREEEQGKEEEDENITEEHVEHEHSEAELDCVSQGKRKGEENNSDVTQEPDMLEAKREDEKEEQTELECNKEEDEMEEDENDEPEDSDSSENITGQKSAQQMAVQQNYAPSIINSLNKDIYHYVGQDIVIYESIDSYGAVMWPAALALCSFLENNRHTMNLQGKEVLELGAGTGLVTIVASLLGASVTATDLPDVLGNLRANVMRNTRNRCRHTPQVAALSWGKDLERSYPSSVYRYDYVLAADVVYHHDFLDELLVTMKYFCKPGTTLIWANKVRFVTDLTFTENFKKAFNTSLLVEDGEMKIFMAMSRE